MFSNADYFDTAGNLFRTNFETQEIKMHFRYFQGHETCHQMSYFNYADLLFVNISHFCSYSVSLHKKNTRNRITKKWTKKEINWHELKIEYPLRRHTEQSGDWNLSDHCKCFILKLHSFDNFVLKAWSLSKAKLAYSSPLLSFICGVSAAAVKYLCISDLVVQSQKTIGARCLSASLAPLHTPRPTKTAAELLYYCYKIHQWKLKNGLPYEASHNSFHISASRINKKKFSTL